METDDGSTSGALFAAVFFDPTAEGRPITPPMTEIIVTKANHANHHGLGAGACHVHRHWDSAALHNDSHLDRREGGRCAKRSTTGYALVLRIERALAHVLGGESFGSALPGRLPGVADEPSSLCTQST